MHSIEHLHQRVGTPVVSFVYLEITSMHMALGPSTTHHKLSLAYLENTCLIQHFYIVLCCKIILAMKC
jgi:hypothetical protein